MRRTLVPAGGGIDSTALALLVLRETEDEVVLSYYREPARELPERIAREQAASEAVADWLSRNVRPVRHVSRDALRLDLDAGAEYPIRGGRGWEGVCDPTFGPWGLDRYATHADEAERHRADRVMLGITSWDTADDMHRMYWYPVYRARTAVPMELPFFPGWEDGAQWPPSRDDPFGPVAGRFMLQALLPPGLEALTWRCTVAAEPCGRCPRCRLNAFFERFCRGRPADGIARIDDALERHRGAGRWYADADPGRWTGHDGYDAAERAVEDPEWWKAELERPCRPGARPGPDRA